MTHKSRYARKVARRQAQKRWNAPLLGFAMFTYAIAFIGGFALSFGQAIGSGGLCVAGAGLLLVSVALGLVSLSSSGLPRD